MSPVCSCGTVLPEDARFCFRCGKPQRESDRAMEQAAAQVSTPAAAVADIPPVSRPRMTWNNTLALRTSFLVASLAAILEIIPGVQILAPILAGFASVSLYQRRSGQALSAIAGAKLGWITAVLNAALLAIFLSVNFLVAGSAVFQEMREAIRRQASSPAQMQVLQMINDPRLLAVFLTISCLFLFLISSLLYMAGGALATRWNRAKSSTPNF